MSGMCRLSMMVSMYFTFGRQASTFIWQCRDASCGSAGLVPLCVEGHCRALQSTSALLCYMQHATGWVMSTCLFVSST